MTGKQMFIRSALTIGLPIILLWAFADELRRGLRLAFRCAWLEVRANIAAYHDRMNREDY